MPPFDTCSLTQDEFQYPLIPLTKHFSTGCKYIQKHWLPIKVRKKSQVFTTVCPCQPLTSLFSLFQATLTLLLVLDFTKLIPHTSIKRFKKKKEKKKKKEICPMSDFIAWNSTLRESFLWLKAFPFQKIQGPDSTASSEAFHVPFPLLEVQVFPSRLSIHSGSQFKCQRCFRDCLINNNHPPPSRYSLPCYSTYFFSMKLISK